MDVDDFWAIIDRSLVGHEADEDADNRHAETLRAVLEPLSTEDLVGFHELFSAMADRARREDVWGAGYTLNGGMSDDSFTDFRSWLISRGRAVYESVLVDPDALADVPGLTVGYSHAAETFAGVAFHLHYEREGGEPVGDEEHYRALVEASIPPAEQARRASPLANDELWDGDEDQRYSRLMALMDAQGVPPLFVSQATFPLVVSSGEVRLSDGDVSVVFTAVHELHLPSVLAGVRIRETTPDEAWTRRNRSLPQPVGRHFLVFSRHFSGHVIADTIHIARMTGSAHTALDDAQP